MRRTTQLGEFVDDPRAFDFLDFIFVDGDAKRLPWSPAQRGVRRLVELAFNTGKCFLGTASAMHAMMHVAATDGRSLDFVNGPQGSPVAKLVDYLPETVGEEAFFLDSLTGDVYEVQDGAWAATMNVGLFKRATRTPASLSAQESRGGKFRNVTPMHVGIERPSKMMNERLLRKSKFALKHWVWDGIPAVEFLAASDNDWRLHEVAELDSKAAGARAMSTLAFDLEASTPAVVEYGHSVGFEFRLVNERQQEAHLMVVNYVKTKYQLMLDFGRLEFMTAETYAAAKARGEGGFTLAMQPDQAWAPTPTEIVAPKSAGRTRRRPRPVATEPSSPSSTSPLSARLRPTSSLDTTVQAQRRKALLLGGGGAASDFESMVADKDRLVTRATRPFTGARRPLAATSSELAATAREALKLTNGGRQRPVSAMPGARVRPVTAGSTRPSTAARTRPSTAVGMKAGPGRMAGRSQYRPSRVRDDQASSRADDEEAGVYEDDEDDASGDDMLFDTCRGSGLSGHVPSSRASGWTDASRVTPRARTATQRRPVSASVPDFLRRKVPNASDSEYSSDSADDDDFVAHREARRAYATVSEAVPDADEATGCARPSVRELLHPGFEADRQQAQQRLEESLDRTPDTSNESNVLDADGREMVRERTRQAVDAAAHVRPASAATRRRDVSARPFSALRRIEAAKANRALKSVHAGEPYKDERMREREAAAKAKAKFVGGQWRNPGHATSVQRLESKEEHNAFLKGPYCPSVNVEFRPEDRSKWVGGHNIITAGRAL